MRRLHNGELHISRFGQRNGILRFTERVARYGYHIRPRAAIIATKGFAQRYGATGINKKGRYTTFDVTNVPILVNQQVIGVYGIASDITYRKELWKRLEESQDLYQLISENAQDIISFATPDGIVRYVSPAIKTSLGYEPDEYMGKVAIDFWHPDDVASFIDECILQKSDVDTFTSRVRHKQGHYVKSY